MNKKILIPALALTIIGSGAVGATLIKPAFASTSANTATITKEQSKEIALKEISGAVTDVELEKEHGTLAYDIEIKDANGIEHDVVVDANSGKVLKTETDNEKDDDDSEVSDEVEKTQLLKEAKISIEESTAIAQAKVKGKVTDAELDDENGVVIYEVEITDLQGQQHEVKIDAKSGKILKVEKDENETKDDDNDGEQYDD
ncbi:PepSY domain-containing protein [Lederbergia wuyishanensis]|uniref:Membrane protein YkoI n=1 Tax=Lederbergia wuyishanensis TaxID=1347903 RepID=A0ABU0D214_9BACI|nr:PepSY domain-containing protein [Lederbergia wuyishanensis]MCJ8007390.1 PepSY domain-containing protein [Lederbergia wuyishanensis]MDQ0342443.1 putative membrane protein YkoI [Lederbergia wuyishanensis]